MDLFFDKGFGAARKGVCPLRAFLLAFDPEHPRSNGSTMHTENAFVQDAQMTICRSCVVFFSTTSVRNLTNSSFLRSRQHIAEVVAQILLHRNGAFPYSF